jgi:hypothetical protein
MGIQIMGSTKQAELLFGIRHEIDSLTGTIRPQGFEQEFKISILDLPHGDVSTLLDNLRAERKAVTGGAHPNQLKLGRQLESEVAALGIPVIPQVWKTLTGPEADAQIKKLIRTKQLGRPLTGTAPHNTLATTTAATVSAGEAARQRMLAGASEDAERRRTEPVKALPYDLETAPVADVFGDLDFDSTPQAKVLDLLQVSRAQKPPVDVLEDNVVNMFAFQRKAV